MSFTGKTTFAAGTTLPEIAEDVGDLVGIIAPYETPLLDALGDPHRAATSTRHEWLEDALLPNTDNVAQPGLNDLAVNTTAFTMAHAGRFRAGDLVQPTGSVEVLQVTAVNTGANQITVQRGYGASTKVAVLDTAEFAILGNAGLEGAEAPDARFSVRARQNNFTQIFSATVQVSGSEAAVRQLAVADELDYQKANRLRELLRDLENTVINGIANDTVPQGSATARRSMRGILRSLKSNIFQPNVAGFPEDAGLTEEQLNMALRLIWERSGSKVDLILCGGKQKRAVNSFIASNQRFASSTDAFKNLVSSYESDFGVCRIVLSRFVPADSLLLLDS